MFDSLDYIDPNPRLSRRQSGSWPRCHIHSVTDTNILQQLNLRVCTQFIDKTKHIALPAFLCPPLECIALGWHYSQGFGSDQKPNHTIFNSCVNPTANFVIYKRAISAGTLGRASRCTHELAQDPSLCELRQGSSLHKVFIPIGGTRTIRSLSAV